MRFLDTVTGQFVEKGGADEESVYAILSHTWDTERGEQTYKELKKIQRRYVFGSRNPQSYHGELEGGTSSSPYPGGGEASPIPPPPQPPEDCPSTPSNSWLTLRMTRLKRWFRPSSTPSSPQPPSDCISAAARPRSITLGRLISYDLAGPILVPASSNPSAPSKEYHSEPPLAPSIWEDHELSPKIRDACAVARKNGYRYIWIDSCCIDKSSSSELSEAINSMYRWYGLAAVCYAYLADVPPGDDHHAEGSRFRTSRWFGRGWTLQELIAPGWVEFLSEDWAPIGSKQSLVELVESVANIHYKALLHLRPLEEFSVAQRLSWAAKRQTTRKEDRAYSLLGIFDIHMPTLYGEGAHAFRRLQERIMQRIPDQSLFAWRDVYLSSQVSHDLAIAGTPKSKPLSVEVRPYYGEQLLFASSPDIFKGCEGIDAPCRDAMRLPSNRPHGIEYTSTPYGVRTRFQTTPLTRDLLLHAIPNSEDIQLNFPGSSEGDLWYLAILGCEHAAYSGHPLGRVCYIRPSEGDVEFVYSGYISVRSQLDERNLLCRSDLFPLSPEAIEYCRPHIELKTVHIPHPDRPKFLSSLQYQPYNAIKLVLLREARDTLRSRGYSADFRTPTPDHPTTHWLTLTKDEHVITIKFQHTLENAGQRFTLDALVEMSGSARSCGRELEPVDSSTDSGDCQADCHTVSWTDPRPPWLMKLDMKSVTLSTAGTRIGPLTVDLALDFAGTGVYVLHADVLTCRHASRSGSSIVKSVDNEDEASRDGDGERTRGPAT